MATSRHHDAGRLNLANATPFVWKRSAKKVKDMSAWAFPEVVPPGATVEVAVAFKGAGGHAQASYQVNLEEERRVT